MSAQECTVQRSPKLTDAARLAIVAAVTAGRSQTAVAREFGIHRNTVWSLCNSAKGVQNQANPFSGDYKPIVETDSFKALIRALNCAENPYEAGKIALKALEGLGVLQSGPSIQVDAAQHLTVVWSEAPKQSTPQDVVNSTIDVTPEHGE